MTATGAGLILLIRVGIRTSALPTGSNEQYIADHLWNQTTTAWFELLFVVSFLSTIVGAILFMAGMASFAFVRGQRFAKIISVICIAIVLLLGFAAFMP